MGSQCPGGGQPPTWETHMASMSSPTPPPPAAPQLAMGEAGETGGAGLWLLWEGMLQHRGSRWGLGVIPAQIVLPVMGLGDSLLILGCWGAQPQWEHSGIGAFGAQRPREERGYQTSPVWHRVGSSPRDKERRRLRRLRSKNPFFPFSIHLHFSSDLLLVAAARGES